MDLSAYLAAKLQAQLLAPGSHFSVYALAAGFLLGFSYLAWSRKRRRGHVGLKPLARAFLSRRLLTHRSTRADILYFFVNVFVTVFLIGWACLTSVEVVDAVQDALTGAFGARTATAAPEWAARGLVTLVVFLAMEFGYWLDHYLKHRIPVLWETHKTHHTAERLTPFTVWRVHPLDSLLFSNIVALSVGLALGATRYALGGTPESFSVAGTNILVAAFFYTFANLQHSEVWLPLRGLPGRLLMSPAHHQLHHSINPAHYNSNLGNCLALFDWLFGTLILPERESPRLTFGVLEKEADPHALTELFLAPFGNVVRALAPARGARQAATPPMNSAAPSSVETSA
ncbi:MAG: sterol desaturase family protein [Methylocystis sp.]|uniref:sterol desaturase family protein n=1 Tax=Methylocystis sp. TaxID=1911079 RepID=UPI003DA441EA